MRISRCSCGTWRRHSDRTILSGAWPLLLALACIPLQAETHPVTLRSAVDIAARQAPEMLLSRIEEQKAQQRVQVARDPFLPKIVVGSGAAYTHGFPMSIEGSAPSIAQARAIASIINQPQKYALAQAREEARTAAFDGQNLRERALFQVVSLYLDAERSGKMADTARSQVESAGRAEEAMRVRVQEGRELPVESKRAGLALARARQRANALQADTDHAEESLALVLGFPAGDRAHPVPEERAAPELPDSAESAVRQALNDNREIRRLESALLARGLEAQSHRAERWPKFDLVAQYALFSRFNNYEDYFSRFSRHNAQLGASITVPLGLAPAAAAAARIADADAARLRVEIQQTRGRVTVEARRAFEQVAQAESGRQVARLDLDVAREDLSILMVRMEEGRATLQQVEQLRQVENEKWLAYLDAHYLLERARYALLDRTGNLAAAVR